MLVLYLGSPMIVLVPRTNPFLLKSPQADKTVVSQRNMTANHCHSHPPRHCRTTRSPSHILLLYENMEEHKKIILIHPNKDNKCRAGGIWTYASALQSQAVYRWATRKHRDCFRVVYGYPSAHGAVSEIENPTVRFRAIFRKRKSYYGAVRCCLQIL